jgi:hypothetical protein
MFFSPRVSKKFLFEVEIVGEARKFLSRDVLNGLDLILFRRAERGAA